MPRPVREHGSAAARVASNVRRIRKSRGMSTYALSTALGALGWPIHQSGVARIETGERRVDVDDLVALAVALGCTVNALMLPPALGADVAVTPALVADAADLWAWATGDSQLQARPAVAEQQDAAEVPTQVLRSLFVIENAPHRFAQLLAP